MTGSRERCGLDACRRAFRRARRRASPALTALTALDLGRSAHGAAALAAATHLPRRARLYRGGNDLGDDVQAAHRAAPPLAATAIVT
jgi:hypothetical protein